MATLNVNMRFYYYQSIKTLVNTIAFVILCIAANAQKGAEVELNKPTQYENRKLASEKTGEKKFTFRRRFMQNTTTHFNYYFNANNRLNDVISRAKASFQDDYADLLSFYNYDLETTSRDKGELDSVIYKATAGILLHDLRSDWVDNMYLLMSKAYLFRNDLDSATMSLQYLNFAFAPKEEGGYDIPIGSNSSNESGEFSIATKEKRGVVKKLTSRPPSRNESFIWQIRTYIEHNELPEAAGLIEILKNDPNFPKRLQTDLNEVTAYWFYKQNVYDSAAHYLSNALDEADDQTEKARWEYLIAQMYQRSQNNALAATFYDRSIKHTTNPVMDVYARLNMLKLNKGDDKNYVQQSIDALLSMAKKDKYLNYRDIIYYAAATIELDRKNYDAAADLLLKSVKSSSNNIRQRGESFLLLADMNFDQKKYTPASNFYDSTDINSLKLQPDKDRVIQRKPPLKIVAANEFMVYSQDSLQALAKLPADKRDAIIKSKLKELRKLKGVKGEDEQLSSNPAILQRQAPDLFGDNSKNTDFYFYNASLKSRGFSEFKAKWGQRPNVDNWRRISAVNQQGPGGTNMDIADMPLSEEKTGPTDLSYESLSGSVPLTTDKLKASNDEIEKALNTLGETFLSSLEDYPSAIEAYEELLKRFPNTSYREKALFNMVYAYSKIGNKEKSNAYKNQLTIGGDSSKYAQLLKNPTLQTKEQIAKISATKKYEQIYNMFIEGDFTNAKAEKKTADSIYGNSYWTPQLLYIESIYYVTQKDDSTAIKVLTDLSSTFATSPMAEKAKTMIAVLSRRAEIEDYLTKLQVTRNEDTTSKGYLPPKQEVAIIQKPTIIQTPVTIKKDSINAPIVTVPKKEEPVAKLIVLAPKKDSINAPIVTVPKKDEPVAKPIVLAPKKDSINTPIVTVPKKDEPVAKPTVLAPKKDSINTPIVTVPKKDEPVAKPTVLAPKKDSINTPIVTVPKKDEPVAKTTVMAPKKEEPVVTPTLPAPKKQEPVAIPKKDTVIKSAPIVPPVKKENTVIIPAKPIVKDTVARVAPAIVVKNFIFKPADPHFVIVVLDKVDPVYASEAKNAFNRYNREKFYNKPIEMGSLKLDDRFNLVLQGPFSDANAAVDYIDKVKPVTNSRILPWLNLDKYSFLVISAENLEVLKTSLDMNAYKQLIQQAFPGKF